MIETGCKFDKKQDGKKYIEITRSAKSILSPQWIDLNKYKMEQNIMTQKEAWALYEIRFHKQMKDPRAIEEMMRIADLSQEVDVVLTCFEKEDTYCHRRLVVDLINDLITTYGPCNHYQRAEVD